MCLQRDAQVFQKMIVLVEDWARALPYTVFTQALQTALASGVQLPYRNEGDKAPKYDLQAYDQMRIQQADTTSLRQRYALGGQQSHGQYDSLGQTPVGPMPVRTPPPPLSSYLSALSVSCHPSPMFGCSCQKLEVAQRLLAHCYLAGLVAFGDLLLHHTTGKQVCMEFVVVHSASGGGCAGKPQAEAHGGCADAFRCRRGSAGSSQ